MDIHFPVDGIASAGDWICCNEEPVVTTTNWSNPDFHIKLRISGVEDRLLLSTCKSGYSNKMVLYVRRITSSPVRIFT